MPGLNGVELLKAIRKDESLVNLPVLILFNGLYGSPMTAEEVYLLGATVVLTKSEFVQSIEIVLANYLP